MSFIRKKTIKGRDYLYEVESIWEQGRVRQRVIAYRGPVEPKRRRKVDATSTDEESAGKNPE